MKGDLLVHLNGWPGSGKLTIARALAPKLQARVLDSATWLHPVDAVFERGKPEWMDARAAVRAAMFKALGASSTPIRVLFTGALAETKGDRALFDDYLKLARKRGSSLLCVVLDCEADENRRRLGDPNRSGRKLAKPELLDDLRSRYALLVGSPVPVRLDVTALPADEAAERIAPELQALTAPPPRPAPTSG